MRLGYAERSRRLSQIEAETLKKTGTSISDLLDRFEQFAEVHTRHMLVDEDEIRGLFSKFDLKFLKMTPTPGECVNPTNSYQIVAARPVNG